MNQEEFYIELDALLNLMPTKKTVNKIPNIPLK